jgi:hypothetical protein
LQKVEDFLYEEVIYRFRTPEQMAEYGGAEKKKWADLVIKCYNIWVITLTPYHGVANAVLQ